MTSYTLLVLRNGEQQSDLKATDVEHVEKNLDLSIISHAPPTRHHICYVTIIAQNV